MNTTILLADDDTELCGLLSEYFETEGFQVRTAHDGKAALDEARKPGLDLVVLDVMMPEMNGMDVLKELRKESRLPVIMLTARRIRAVMRRAQGAADHGILNVDDLELRQGSRMLFKAGKQVELTSTEFSILQSLLQHQGEVVSKRDLYVSALGREPVPHDRSVDMHVSNLRRKLGPDQDGNNRIETIRGIGYQFRTL
jgi:two-component system response regulator CpxR